MALKSWHERFKMDTERLSFSDFIGFSVQFKCGDFKSNFCEIDS